MGARSRRSSRWLRTRRSATRGEIAVLPLRARHGAGFEPTPATGTVLADAPDSASQSLAVIDTAANAVVGTVPLEGSTSAVAVTPIPI